MKKYTIKVGLIFIMLYMIIAGLLYGFYILFYNNYVDQQTQGTLKQINDASATGIDADLLNQRNIFLTQIDSFKYQYGSNYIEQLNASIELISFHGSEKDVVHNFELIGEITSHTGAVLDRALVINNITLPYEQSIFKEEFDSNIAIYSPKDAFGLEKASSCFLYPEEKYLFIIGENEIAAVRAKDYFSPLIVSGSKLGESSIFFIIADDGQILFSNANFDTLKYIYDYPRNDGYLEADIQVIISKIHDLETGTSPISFLKEKAFLTYRPLSNLLFGGASTYNGIGRGLVVSRLFLRKNVESAEVFVSFSLIGVLIISALAFIGVTMILYRLLVGKNDDIETSRLTIQYSKPFVVKISANGKIKWVNKKFDIIYRKSLALENIREWGFLGYDDKELAIEDIKKQKPVTAIIPRAEENTLIRFIIIRFQGGLLLIGEDVTGTISSGEVNKNLAFYNKVTGLPNINLLNKNLLEIFNTKEKLANN
ncbi:MAG: hypothetical protein LBV58_04640, partial [Acholeplasmatales bacterium]|nr:hypothetical protein [Acholeplasmatales bacterium]